MAKAKKGKSGGGGAPKEMLLVASKVKGMIKDAGCNTAGDALEGLNLLVGWYIQQAARRAFSLFVSDGHQVGRPALGTDAELGELSEVPLQSGAGRLRGFYHRQQIT
jgi:hypothetical protein